MCSADKIEMEDVGKRRLDVDFSAGRVSSDGGGVLLSVADQRLALCRRLAACFTDHRKAHLIDLLAWCEETRDVDYVIGLAKNSRLKQRLAKSMKRAHRKFLTTGKSARAFHDFRYRTLGG